MGKAYACRFVLAAVAAGTVLQLAAVDPLIGTGQTVDGVVSCEKDGTNTVVEAGATTVEADACGATFAFAQSGEARILFVKCSVSLVSDANLKTFMDEEIAAWDFDGTCEEARAAWNEKFNLLKFTSGDPDVVKTLSTAIYHALQWPRDVTEFGRHYSPSTDGVRDGVMYTGQSMWDTYRAENALLGFLAPDRISDMMRALVTIADEGGYLPLYPNPGETSCMVGAPGEIQLSEAVQKGWLRGADAEAAVRDLDAYEASVTRTKDGLVLHDDHGNEPAHHIPYLYNLLGRHDACAKAVREIMADYYPSSRQWRRGHDDCGQTSAWYVFSALGFYPVNPPDCTYEIGSPLVERAELSVGGGKTFRIVVRNQARENVYVKSVTLNGRELVPRRLRHSDIVAGGELVFEMAATPGRVQ